MNLSPITHEESFLAEITWGNATENNNSQPNLAIAPQEPYIWECWEALEVPSLGEAVSPTFGQSPLVPCSGHQGGARPGVKLAPAALLLLGTHLLPLSEELPQTWLGRGATTLTIMTVTTTYSCNTYPSQTLF